MAVVATTVKKPSENSPIKRANRRRCERKQKPQNRVRATKGRNWEKTVEDASLLHKQMGRGEPAALRDQRKAGFSRGADVQSMGQISPAEGRLPA